MKKPTYSIFNFDQKVLIILLENYSQSQKSLLYVHFSNLVGQNVHLR